MIFHWKDRKYGSGQKRTNLLRASITQGKLDSTAFMRLLRLPKQETW